MNTQEAAPSEEGEDATCTAPQSKRRTPAHGPNTGAGCPPAGADDGRLTLFSVTTGRMRRGTTGRSSAGADRGEGGACFLNLDVQGKCREHWHCAFRTFAAHGPFAEHVTSSEKRGKWAGAAARLGEKSGGQRTHTTTIDVVSLLL